jgi:lipid II isoglutaminyl synthase (glutamine-hydrolysing)
MLLIKTLIAKTGYLIIKTFGLGSGYTWPGYFIWKFFPETLSRAVFDFPEGVILVSGTNGKTTTVKLISAMLEGQGLRVLSNKSGANLLGGLLSTLLLDLSVFGKSDKDVAVLEVDELTLPNLVKTFPPDVLVLLNLSRDQLDRYGEIDYIFNKWVSCVDSLSPSTTLIYDSTQPLFKDLSADFSGKVSRFSDDPEFLKNTPLLGSFNAKNLNAALGAVEALEVDSEKALSSVSSFDFAYGRGEAVSFKECLFRVFLAKNPASMGNNLKLLSLEDLNPEGILFVLNDEVRDGADISWFYDVSPEELKEACAGKEVFVSGNRCYDFSVRLMYAGVEVSPQNVSLNLKSLVGLVAKKYKGKEVLIFPNYSAMLETRKILIGRSIL